MNIPELIKEAHDNAAERGFYDCPKCAGGKITCAGAGQCDHDGTECNMDDNCGEFEFHTCNTCKGSCIDPNKNIGELLMLIVSELGEALEAHRCGRFAPKKLFSIVENKEIDWKIKMPIEDYDRMFKNTFEDEIADVFVRLFDLCAYLGIEPEIVRGGVNWRSRNVGDKIRMISKKVLELDPDFTNSKEFKTGIGFIIVGLGFIIVRVLRIEKKEN